ncbi:hypothetical protein L1987_89217 [Smallanthus sonchifolius]|nr:hypothetical protein L1987_89217 [Smallanthus sonchifolius]
MDQSRGSAASSNSLSAPLHFLCWTGRCESGRPSHHAKFKPRRRGIENRGKKPFAIEADLKGALSVPPYAPRH